MKKIVLHHSQLTTMFKILQILGRGISSVITGTCKPTFQHSHIHCDPDFIGRLTKKYLKFQVRPWIFDCNKTNSVTVWQKHSVSWLLMWMFFYNFLHFWTKTCRETNSPDLILNACVRFYHLNWCFNLLLASELLLISSLNESLSSLETLDCIYNKQIIWDEHQSKPSSQTVFLGNYPKSCGLKPNNTYLTFGAGLRRMSWGEQRAIPYSHEDWLEPSGHWRHAGSHFVGSVCLPSCPWAPPTPLQKLPWMT